MKKLFIIMIMCVLIVIISIEINANRNVIFTGMSIEDMNIDESILTKIKSLGIDIQNAACTELEPDELKNYNDFVKEDKDSQVNKLTWSTIHPNKLKLNIKIKSSSTLKEYPVTNLVDKKIETTWVPKVKGANDNGIGEWISIELNPEANSTDCPVRLYYFGMIPGYLKSNNTWEENNRVKSALLIIERYRHDEPEKNIDYAILRLNFNDFKGIQVFNIANYEGFTSTNKKIWIVIEDVYKGTKYSDTCISEMAIGGGIPVYFFEP